MDQQVTETKDPLLQKEKKSVGLEWKKLSNNGRVLFGSSAAQALIVMSIESATASIFAINVDIGSNDREKGSGKSIFVYLSIFIFSQIFQLFIIIDALYNQNTIQIFTHTLFNYCMLAFSIFKIFQIREALEVLEETSDVFDSLLPLLITTCVVIGVASAGSLFNSYRLYLEFGWKIYKKIGADPKIRSMFKMYQILIMLLKFDLYFFLAFAVQFLVLVLSPDNYEVPLTIIALILSPFVVYLVITTVRREWTKVMYLWLGFNLLTISYFAFKISRIYDPRYSDRYVGSGKFLTLFASVSILFFGMTFVVSIICLRNFGKGLQPHILETKERKKDDQNENQKKMLLS